MQKTASIVIPTFYEAQNLPALLVQVHGVFNTLPDCGHEYIVVDDASMDDTGAVRWVPVNEEFPVDEAANRM